MRLLLTIIRNQLQNSFGSIFMLSSAFKSRSVFGTDVSFDQQKSRQNIVR